MAYCELTDLKNRFSEKLIAELSDDQSGTSVNSSIVTEAIADADAFIDMHIGARYSLPLSSTPQIITFISCILTIHMLYGRRPESDVPEKLADEFDQSVKILEKLQSGDMALASDYTSAGSRFKTNKTLDNNQEFSLETLSGFFSENTNNTANA